MKSTTIFAPHSLHIFRNSVQLRHTGGTRYERNCNATKFLQVNFDQISSRLPKNIAIQEIIPAGCVPPASEATKRCLPGGVCLGDEYLWSGTCPGGVSMSNEVGEVIEGWVGTHPPLGHETWKRRGARVLTLMDMGPGIPHPRVNRHTPVKTLPSRNRCGR